MDEQELAKPFKTMEGDTQVQAAYAATPRAPPVRKRITIADLKKDIESIEDLLSGLIPEILATHDHRLDTIEEGSLSDRTDVAADIAARLDNLEATTAKHNETLLEDVNIRIHVLENFISKSTVGEISTIKARLDTLEQGSLSDRTDVAADIATRLDDHDAAINVLIDTINARLVKQTATPPELDQELEFTSPPQQMAGGLATKSDIETVAGICETMTDVLMISRALKATPDLPDKDRTYLLTVACTAAGVPLSPGLQIRAGVRHVEV